MTTEPTQRRTLQTATRGLRELVVIVAGVLVALGVDSLREDAADRRIMEEYLRAVAEEVRFNGRTLAYMHEDLLPRKMAALERVIAFLEQPNALVTDSAAFFEDLATSAKTVRPWLTSDRYESMRSSGTLRLLRDPNIAAGLAWYYRAPDVLFPAADEQRGGFLAAVNQLIPHQLADDLSQTRGYAQEPQELILGDPSFAASLRSVRERRLELLALARSEAAYAASYSYSLSRFRSDSEALLINYEASVR